MRLTRWERRWAEVALAAVLPGAVAGPTFWDRLEGSAAPTFGPGLRAIVWWVQWRPLLARGRPFSRLDPAEREATLRALDADPAWLPRQVVGTLKILAGFARFDRPEAP